MRKIYRKLTKDQKQRHVIFSSELYPSGVVHEVIQDPVTFIHDSEKIDRLRDDRFFNDSPYKYNLIRQ